MSKNKSKFNEKYTQGEFHPQNPEKYIGNINEIIFRSSWEYAFCIYLDQNKTILSWGVEIPIIHYRDLHNKSHRYFPDFFYTMMINNDPNNLKRVVVEIKPSTELYPPNPPKNQTTKALENFEYAVRMHIRNKLKWEAAVSYCAKRKMEFVIITEKRLQKEGIIKS